MKKKIFSILLSILMLMGMGTVPVVHAQNNIICTTLVEGNRVQISGQIENVDKRHQVTLLVGEIERILYVNQVTSDADGTFKFNFALPQTLDSGEYNFTIGTDADCVKYTGVLEYTAGLIAGTEQFIDMDVNVNIIGYVPRIEGTIQCMSGVEAVLSIVNETAQETIASDAITVEDGVYTLSYTLPSLARTTKYTVSIMCSDANGNVAGAAIMIESSILKISIDGNIDTANGVTVNGSLSSTNTGIIDKSVQVTSDKSFSGSIPNIAAVASFHLTAQGYVKRYKEYQMPQSPSVVRTVIGNANDIVKLTFSAGQIKSFLGKTFKIEYNPKQIQPEDIPKSNNIQIVSQKEGEIVFRVIHINASNSNIWNGAIDMFNFRFRPDYSGSTTITLR